MSNGTHINFDLSGVSRNGTKPRRTSPPGMKDSSPPPKEKTLRKDKSDKEKKRTRPVREKTRIEYDRESEFGSDSVTKKMPMVRIPIGDNNEWFTFSFEKLFDYLKDHDPHIELVEGTVDPKMAVRSSRTAGYPKNKIKLELGHRTRSSNKKHLVMEFKLGVKSDRKCPLGVHPASGNIDVGLTATYRFPCTLFKEWQRTTSFRKFGFEMEDVDCVHGAEPNYRRFKITHRELQDRSEFDKNNKEAIDLVSSSSEKIVENLSPEKKKPKTVEKKDSRKEFVREDTPPMTDPVSILTDEMRKDIAVDYLASHSAKCHTAAIDKLYNEYYDEFVQKARLRAEAEIEAEMTAEREKRLNTLNIVLERQTKATQLKFDNFKATLNKELNDLRKNIDAAKIQQGTNERLAKIQQAKDLKKLEEERKDLQSRIDKCRGQAIEQGRDLILAMPSLRKPAEKQALEILMARPSMKEAAIRQLADRLAIEKELNKKVPVDPGRIDEYFHDNWKVPDQVSDKAPPPARKRLSPERAPTLPPSNNNALNSNLIPLGRQKSNPPPPPPSKKTKTSEMLEKLTSKLTDLDKE